MNLNVHPQVRPHVHPQVRPHVHPQVRPHVHPQEILICVRIALYLHHHLHHHHLFLMRKGLMQKQMEVIMSIDYIDQSIEAIKALKEGI